MTTATAQPFPGAVSDYHGFTRYDFVVDGCAAIVVAPAQPLTGTPWVWRAEFFDAFPGIDLALLAEGFHLAYIQVGNTFGCPDALQHWDVFYAALTTQYGLAAKPVLEGLSRGGLYIYNWAARNTGNVGVLFGDAPVCDFKSWPGGKGKGDGSTEDWQQLLQAYHFASEEEALSYPLNPIDNLQPLAAARIPIIHVYGDADTVVPHEENTAILERRYRQLGGEILTIAKPGVGHHPHGLPDPSPVVDFIIRHLGLR
jgi:alpha-beta hydrolase superfamily lysophospholipase